MKATFNNSSKLLMNQFRKFDDEEGFPQNQQTVDRIIKLKKILMYPIFLHF